MAERCPQMKEPLLTRLLDVVMKQCTLSVDAGSQNPLSSVSEADDEDDDDAIGAFRVGSSHRHEEVLLVKPSTTACLAQ